jgi:hypothetical protein
MKKKNSKTKTFLYIRAASYASADGLIGFAHIQVKARDELEAYSKGYKQIPRSDLTSFLTSFRATTT